MSVARVVVTAASLVALVGCSKQGGAGRDGNADGPPLPSAELAALLDAVPTDAALVVTLGLREPLWSQLTGGWLVPMQPELRDQLDQELAAQVAELTGLDARAARAAVLSVSGTESGSLLVHGVRGELAGATGEHAGAAIRIPAGDGPAVGHRRDVLVVASSRAELEAALDRLASGDGGLAGELRAQVDRAAEGATLAAVADVKRLVSALELELPPAARELSFARAHLGGDGLRIALAGPDAALDGIEAKLGFGAMGARMAMNRQRAAVTDPVEGMMVTLAYYYAENALRHLEPARVDGDLVMELPFAEHAGPNAAVIGIIAVAAIPPFMEYIKKSKGAEARAGVHRLAASVRAYHAAHGSLPESVGPTPPLGTCCAAGTKCPANPTAWQVPAWQALGFSVDGAHYYSYEYVRQGDAFAVRALGDLDCDGAHSTFQLTGQVEGGAIVGADRLAVTDPIE